MAIFPVEVCDMIIDQVPVLQVRTKRGIKPNRELASCALVCRSWARHSRSRHFKSLRLRGYLAPFLDLLSSPHATIVPHIRDLDLVIHSTQQSKPISILNGLASLRALESISIYFSDNYIGSVLQITAWLGSFSHLRRMALSGFMLDSFNPLRDMICACRGLESLHIYDVRSAAAYGILPPHPAPPEPQGQLTPSHCPPLQVLEWKGLDSPFVEQFLEWLVACTPSLPLRSLFVEARVAVQHQALLGRLLRALGTALEELSIRWSLYMSCARAVSYEHIDLRYNTRLEVLSFWSCDLSIIRSQFLSLASQVTSSRFRELNISLSYISEEEFAMLETGPESLPELAAIDTLLQRPNFANLESLNLRSFNLGLTRVLDLMQEFFPHTTARNLTRVRDSSEMW